MRNTSFIFALCFFCLLQSCTGIEGTYVANYHIGTDTVKIFSNHKYAKICYPSNAPKDKIHFIDSGTWSVTNGAINFRDWVDRNGMFHSYDDGPSIFVADIKRNYFTGGIKLLIDYDKEYYYIKQ